MRIGTVYKRLKQAIRLSLFTVELFRVFKINKQGNIYNSGAYENKCDPLVSLEEA